MNTHKDKGVVVNDVRLKLAQELYKFVEYEKEFSDVLDEADRIIDLFEQSKTL